jgi:hypothetical protein
VSGLRREEVAILAGGSTDYSAPGATRPPSFWATPRLDILARNPLAGALYGAFTHFDTVPHMTFLDRAAHDFRHDWDQAADSRVATPHRGGRQASTRRSETE